MTLLIAMLSLVICADAFQYKNYLAGWGWGIIAFYSFCRVWIDDFSNKRYERKG